MGWADRPFSKISIDSYWIFVNLFDIMRGVTTQGAAKEGLQCKNIKHMGKSESRQHKRFLSYLVITPGIEHSR